MQAGCFIDVKGAADIGVEDFLERPLDGDAAEMGDGIYAFAQGMHGRLVGEVARHDLLVFAGCRGHRRDIGQSDDAGVGLQACTQLLAEAAGCTGEQKAAEWGCRSGCHRSACRYCSWSHLLSYDMSRNISICFEGCQQA